jgi:solute carrier family 25 (mitochondrial phosphate transporter), member 23/24/25/41
MHSVSDVRKLFDNVDRNDDGIVDTFELNCYAKQMGLRINHDQMRSFMNKIDTDGDGKISFEEFYHFIKDLPSVNPQAVFEAFSDEKQYDDAEGGFTPPRIEPRDVGTSLWAAMASKLYSGSIAGATSRTVTAPIDTLKAVMQSKPAGGGGGGGGGLVAELRGIMAQGGIRAFYRGNGVNCLKIAPETSIKFIAFDFYRNRIAKDKGNPLIFEKFMAGGAAGATAQAIVYPLEIGKTRLQISAPGTYSGLVDALQKVVAENGMKGLYRGLGTSVLGIIPYAGIDLAANSFIKQLVSARMQERGEEPGVMTLLGSGMASSTVAMFCTYPIGLTRTRLQASGLPGKPAYSSAADVIKQTLLAEGFKGLYRGMVPNLAKVLPATSISYAIYDILSKK